MNISIPSPSRFFLAFIFFAACLAAIAAEPGPEADGVYSCGNVGGYKGGEFVAASKYIELVKLELRGRTYRDYKEGTAIEKRGEFSPFTVDAQGHIKWTNRFTFLSHVSSLAQARTQSRTGLRRSSSTTAITNAIRL
jgi:hypothetical protein